MSRSWLSLDTYMSRLVSCLEFPCLVMSPRDCVLTVSLSGIAKCLFRAEALAFLAESRPLVPFTRCLLIYCKTVVLVVVVFYGYNVS